MQPSVHAGIPYVRQWFDNQENARSGCSSKQMANREGGHSSKTTTASLDKLLPAWVGRRWRVTPEWQEWSFQGCLEKHILPTVLQPSILEVQKISVESKNPLATPYVQHVMLRSEISHKWLLLTCNVSCIFVGETISVWLTQMIPTLDWRMICKG